jgi:hypothetical protein
MFTMLSPPLLQSWRSSRRRGGLAPGQTDGDHIADIAVVIRVDVPVGRRGLHGHKALILDQGLALGLKTQLM